MNQPVFEVRERKSVLVSGIICTLLFGAAAVLTVAATIATGEDEVFAIIYGLLVFGVLAGLGIYLILAYLNHRLKVFSNGEMIYSSSLGKKVTFKYGDIAKLEQKYIKTAMSITLKNAEGKRLAKVESNMKGYEQLTQWLNTQKQAADKARAQLEEMGVSAGQEMQVEPVQVKGTGKAARAFLVIMGIFMIFAAGGSFMSLTESDSASEAEVEAQWFDPTAEYEGKQMVEFEMISYPFASFELSDSQGLYFVFDTDMCVYIVCMDNERLETEFKDIYDYTFSDSEVTAGLGELEGYAMPIDEELKAIAIEEFNYLWGSNVFTEENFEEYAGAYYLDTTYVPESSEESVSTIVVGGIFFLAIGIYLIYYAVKGYKKAEQKIAAQSAVKGTVDAAGGLKAHVESVSGTAEASGLEKAVHDASAEAASVSGAGELPIPGNIFIALIASVVCAAAGGLLWIVFYKLGRIAAISGYLAVFGAMYGYSKFGKRELKGGAVVWCILVGVAMIIGANFISYAWEIVDAVNAANPGRAEFGKVLMNMPQMMKEWELWGSFLSDLVMGLVFALLAGVGSLFGKKKK